MAKLIYDVKPLMALIPNMVINVEDEPSILEKLSTYIDVAQQRFSNDICPVDYVIDGSVSGDNLARVIVTADAVYMALAGLDLVMTPTGLGVVSTDTISPASKDRSAAMANSLLNLKNNSVLLFLSNAVNFEVWRKSEAAKIWKSSLFHNIDVVPLLLGPDIVVYDFIDSFKSLLPEIQRIEDSLADDYISHELLSYLRERSICFDGFESPHFEMLLRQLRNEVIVSFRKKDISVKRMLRIVNLIRDCEDEFPQWHSSSVSKYFTGDRFKNEKDNRGYFL